MKTLLILAALAAACPADAQSFSAEASRTVLVRYGDLDLSTSTGRARLQQRVNRAVRHACPIAEPMGASDIAVVSSCRDGALKNAGAQMAALTGRSGNAGVRYSR